MKKKISMLLAMLLVCAMVIGMVKASDIKADTSKVKLNAAEKTMYVGEKFQLVLEGSTGKIKWSTSSKKKATVSDGLVTAVKTGKVTIKAKNVATGKTYSCKITIKKNSLSKTKLSLKAGEITSITLKGNTAAEWTSSNEAVAYVNNGTVKALKKGKATITAKVGKKKYTCKVTVTGTDSKAKEDVELTLWCLSSEGGVLPYEYERAIADLSAAYPNVKVEYATYENEDYKVKIKSALADGELPDIYYTWSGAFLGDFVDNGMAYCLDDTMAKYKSSGDITDAMLKNSTYDGKNYGVPLSMNVVTLFANTELLKEAGYDAVPGTIEELLDCCDKLLEKGITPFGCSGVETWCITEYLEPMIVKYIGADALYDIFSGKASFNNEFVAESVDLLRTMILKGYFDQNGLSLASWEIVENFINGDYAFFMNGSWNCGQLASDPEFCSKVTVAEFPVIDLNKSGQGELVGGPSNTLAVSSKSKNPELAAEYAAALGKLISKYNYLDGQGLPTWKIGYDDSAVDELTKQVAKMCAKAKSFVLFGDTAMTAENTEIYLKYVKALLTPDMDGKAFIKGLSKEIK